MYILENFDSKMNNLLTNIMNKPSISRGLIHLLLVLYAAKIAPVLPNEIYKIFDNQYFKLFVFSLIVWTAQVNPSTSILIAICFMISINYYNKRVLWEFMENFEGIIERENDLAEYHKEEEEVNIIPLPSSLGVVAKTQTSEPAPLIQPIEKPIEKPIEQQNEKPIEQPIEPSFTPLYSDDSVEGTFTPM